MASPSRRSGWIIAGSLALVVLALIAVVLWVWLPRWAPSWVLSNSPWFEPAFRAAEHAPGTQFSSMRILAERIRTRSIPGGIAAVAAMQIDPDASCRGKAITLIHFMMELNQDPVPLAMLVRSMQYDPDAGLRARSITMMSEHRLDDVRATLITALGDTAADVRAAACRKLGTRRNRAAATALIPMLRDPVPQVVIAACAGLRDLYDAQAVDPLFLLIDHPDQDIAYAAWEAVCWLRCNAEQTIRLGRLPVARVLGWNGIYVQQENHGENFIARLRFDKQALTWGEERIGDLILAMASREGAAVTAAYACRALVVVLAGERMREGADGVEGGWILRTPEQHAERNRRVAMALRRGVDVQAALVQACSDKNPTLRCYALVGLRGSDTEDARSAAVRSLDDQDTKVVLEAALNLAVIHDDRALAPLVRMLHEGGMMERAGAGLGALADQRAIEPLIAVLTDRGGPERTDAALALGEMGDLRAVDPLIRTLGSSLPSSRAAVVLALGKLGDWRATVDIIGCLGDEDDTVRKLAVMGLRLLSDPRAIEPLIARLDDQDAEVRQQVVLALRILHDPRAVEPLIRRLTDTDHVVVMFAVNTLVELGDPRVADFLLSLLDHPGSYSLPWVVEALAMVPLTEEQRSRLCSPSRDPEAVTSSAAPAATGSTPPPP